MSSSSGSASAPPRTKTPRRPPRSAHEPARKRNAARVPPADASAGRRAAPSAPPIGIAVCRIAEREAELGRREPRHDRASARGVDARAERSGATSALVTPAKRVRRRGDGERSRRAGEPGRDHPALVDAVGDETPRQEREQHPDPGRREHDARLAEREPVVALQRRPERRQADRRRGEGRLRERPAQHDPAIAFQTLPNVQAGMSRRATARTPAESARVPAVRQSRTASAPAGPSSSGSRRRPGRGPRARRSRAPRAVLAGAGSRGRRPSSRRSRRRGCSRAGRGSSRTARRSR